MLLVLRASHVAKLRLAALSTLLNICQDYEPGQIVAAQKGIVSDLESMLSTLDRPEFHVSLQLLSAIFPKLKETGESMSSNMISRCISNIARAPGINYDQDDFITCMDAMIPILQDQNIQETIARSDHKIAILDLLENT